MADPLTIVRAGNGTSTVTYDLPKDVWQYVESVLVEIDNTAGGDAQPTLQVKASPSVVIAAKQLGGVIPAGDTGTATWALRLADEARVGGSSTARIVAAAIDAEQTVRASDFTPYSNGTVLAWDVPIHGGGAAGPNGGIVVPESGVWTGSANVGLSRDAVFDGRRVLFLLVLDSLGTAVDAGTPTNGNPDEWKWTPYMAGQQVPGADPAGSDYQISCSGTSYLMRGWEVCACVWLTTSDPLDSCVVGASTDGVGDANRFSLTRPPQL